MRQYVIILVALVGLASILEAAPPKDEDPLLQGVRLSEWLERLRGDKEASIRDPLLLVVGGTAIRGVDERLYLGRRAGLVACQLIGNNPTTKSLRRVVPALLAALHDDPDLRIREAAATGLGRLSIKVLKDDPRQLEDLRDGLVNAIRLDKSAPVRQQAVLALGQTDPDARGDYRLIHELANKLDVLVAALKDADVGVSNAASETIRRMGKAATPASSDLIVLLRNKNLDPLTRTNLALALGRITSTEALPALQEILADNKAPLDLRRAVCEALSNFGKNAVDLVSTLANLLTASDVEVELKRAAAGALDKLGSDAIHALPALKKGLKDEDKFVRCLCLHAIGQMGKELGAEGKDVITALLNGLNDPTIEVRVAVLETFGNLGKDGLGTDAPAIVEKLNALTKDGLKEVRDAAENTLRKLNSP